MGATKSFQHTSSSEALNCVLAQWRNCVKHYMGSEKSMHIAHTPPTRWASTSVHSYQVSASSTPPGNLRTEIHNSRITSYESSTVAYQWVTTELYKTSLFNKIPSLRITSTRRVCNIRPLFQIRIFGYFSRISGYPDFIRIFCAGPYRPLYTV